MSKKIVYAFIDSQNLNLGTSKNIYKNRIKIYKGWKLDFKKFRRYLTDKFKVNKAFLFIGYIPKYKSLYKQLKSNGYKLIFKPTVNDKSGKPKGNVDAELVLHASAIEFQKYDKAVIISGDGDFRCLHEFLVKKRKLLRIIIPNTKSESSLLKPFQKYKTFIIHEKQKLELSIIQKGRRRVWHTVINSFLPNDTPHFTTQGQYYVLDDHTGNTLKVLSKKIQIVRTANNPRRVGALGFAVSSSRI